MTLTNRKGNIRGREFPTDTGIDGNACEETTKDQRWVGYRHQIPNPDTTNLYSLHLSSPKSVHPTHSILLLPLFAGDFPRWKCHLSILEHPPRSNCIHYLFSMVSGTSKSTRPIPIR